MDDPKGSDLRRRRKETPAALRGETLSPLWRDPDISVPWLVRTHPFRPGTERPLAPGIDRAIREIATGRLVEVAPERGVGDATPEG